MGNYFEVTGSGGSEGKVDFKLKGTANLVLENSTSLPGSGVEGQIFWKSDTNELYIYNGASWQLVNPAGGVTYPLTAPDGTVSAPSYSFSSDSDVGMYLIGTDHLGFSTNGTLALEIDGSQYVEAKFLRAIPRVGFDGNAHFEMQMDSNSSHIWDIYTSAAPPYNLTLTSWAYAQSTTLNAQQQLSIGDTLTLKSFPGTGIITSTSTTTSRTFTLPDITGTFAMLEGSQTFSGTKTFGTQAYFFNGNGSAPGIAFSAETNSGLYFITGGQWAASAQGTVATYFTTNGLQANTGSVGSPGYAFAADTDTGMYWIGSNNLGFATSGTQRLSLTTTALIHSVDCVPNADITNDNRNSSHRWLNIWGQTIHSGDIQLENNWKITEGDKVGHPEEGVVILSPDGKKYKLAMTELQ